MAQYLFRRNGQYYFRLRIPASQRHHFNGKQEIRKALGTYNRQVAIYVSAVILAEMKKRFTQKDIDALHEISKKEEDIRRAYLDPVLRLIKIKKNGADIEIDYDNDDVKEIEAANRILGNSPDTNNQNTTPLTDVIAKYCKERTGRKWTDKTAFEARNIFNLLVEIVGNIPVYQLDYVLARSYKETLQQLPPNRRKKPRYRNLSIDQIIATKPKQTLSTHTINKHLSKCNALCDWMMRHGYVEKNFFKGLHIEVETRPDDEREVFTTEDLIKIFLITIEFQPKLAAVAALEAYEPQQIKILG